MAEAPRSDDSGALARLLAEVEADFAATAHATGCAQLDPRVRAALAAVPRARFVPRPWRAWAQANRPLPIGHGQTISQPFVVALMTQLLALRDSERVLEIGTGCGYQAAVLAQLGARVTSVERVPALSRRAQRTLAALGVAGVELHVADGHAGWPPGAPYDAIIATAAAAALPPAWVEQLAPGGRLVAPVGQPDGEQWLHLLRKAADGSLVQTRALAVRFVPLLGATAPAASAEPRS